MDRHPDSPASSNVLLPRALIAIGVVGMVVVGFLLLRAGPEEATQPIPAPDGTSGDRGLLREPAPLETVAPAQSGVQRGDNAREIIASLRADADGVDYAEAYDRALDFLAEGRSADAQLLLFFAARGGHGPSAFELASQYDPNYVDGEDGSLGGEPDAFQAYRWYGEAAAAGEEAATQRLSELRAWAEDAVAAGDVDAEQLLLQWESLDEL